jgi:hypothetical protein
MCKQLHTKLLDLLPSGTGVHRLQKVYYKFQLYYKFLQSKKFSMKLVSGGTDGNHNCLLICHYL